MVDGKALRRRAWKRSSERRWPLVRLQLLAAVPGLTFLLPSLLYRVFSEGGTVPQWVGWPFSIAGQVLGLGLTMVALRYVDGDDAPGGFFFYATRERFGKALLLALSLWAIPTAISLASGGLTSYGKALELAGTRGGLYLILGNLVSLAGNFLTGIFLFFANYLFVWAPEGSVWGHWKRSFSLGSAYFIEIFVFQFWLMVPLVVSFFAAAVIMAALVPIGQAAFAVIILLLLVGLFIFYSPYCIMADALFADTVMKEEQKAERKREKKKKRLAKQAGREG